MIERCSCNALIFTFRYERVIEWRKSHRHEVEAPPEPEPHGGGMSDNQIAYDDHDYHRPRIGFSPNGI